MSTSPAGVHNATFFHDMILPDVVNAEQSLFRELEVIDNFILIQPTGCNELQLRIHSIQERMRFQMSVGFVLGKCIRAVTEKITDYAAGAVKRMISLRECLAFQQRDLLAADLKMRTICS